MAINERLIHTAAGAAGDGTGNQEEGLILHLDANDVDSYDGDGSVWYDITNHEYTPAVNPAENFNTVAYTGTGASNSITGVGFQPDMIWIKNRDSVDNHYLLDSLRGKNGSTVFENLYPNLTNGQANDNAVTSLDSDGFTMQASGNGNASGTDFVAWCFKAGGVPSGSDKVSIDGTSYATMTEAGLTDGTEALDSLSVNTKLGFSIAKWSSSTALTTDTVAHGLGQPPELIIHKSTSLSRNWNVYSTGVGLSKNLHLNLTDGAATNEYWTVNANTFSIHDTSSSGNWVAYSFASKRGVSKVGSYIGSTGSVKVYTGFQPAFVMIKNADVSGDPWVMLDNKRPSGGGVRSYLYPSENYVENTGGGNRTGITFNADGFTLDDDDSHSANESGKKFIYLAFAAEKPSNLIDDTDLKLHIDIGNSSCYSGTGTTVNDLSSSNHTITTLAGVEAADFDKEVGNFLTVKENSNEGLTIADHADFDHDNGATYEGWVYLDPDGTSEETFFYRGESGSAKGLRIYWHSSYGWFPRDFNSSGTEIIDQNNIKTGITGYGRGKWYHLALTLSSASDATYKFYVDSVFIGSYTASTGSGQKSQSYGISLGKYGSGGTPDLQGAIGQFRFYKTVLTEDEILQNYRFTKNDYPNGFNASNTSNPPSFSTDHFQFDRVHITSGDQMIFGSSINSMLNNLTEYTFTAWYYPDNLNGRNTIFGVGHTTSNNVWALFRVRDNGNAEYSLNDSGTAKGATFTGASPSSTNDQWNFIAFTVSATGAATCRVNGTSYSPTYNSGSDVRKFSDVAFNTVTLGSLDRGSTGQFYDPFNGRIGQIRLYDKVLTNDEIDAIEALGR